jgi:hypothetical protein
MNVFLEVLFEAIHPSLHGIGWMLSLNGTLALGVCVFLICRSQLRRAGRSTAAPTVAMAALLLVLAPVASILFANAWARYGIAANWCEVNGQYETAVIIVADGNEISRELQVKGDDQSVDVQLIRHRERASLEVHDGDADFDEALVELANQYHRARAAALAEVGPRITWGDFMRLERRIDITEKAVAHLRARQREPLFLGMASVGAMNGLCLLAIHLLCRRRIT